MTSPRPVLLGGYAAKQCARRVHNDWDATIDAEPVPVPAELLKRCAAGRDFETRVRAELIAALGARCVDVPDTLPKTAAMETTVAAMASGAEVVIGGWLTDDTHGHRTGRPDLLLRVTANGDDYRYVAGDIKAHLSAKSSTRGTWTYSTVAQPADIQTTSGRTPRIADRFDDHVQLAHYTRMLQAIGRAPDGEAARGFIIGTDAPPEGASGDVVLTWLDLDDAIFTTFSRSRGTAKRSAMERYDHEHAFRVKVAKQASQRHGDPMDPPPLVVPVITDECDVCPWREYCRDLIGPDAASAILEAGRLDVREWQALAANGVATAQDLAALDLQDAQWWESYLPEVTHQARAKERLTTAVRRARMALAGVRLERTTSGPIDVPTADVEIDVDIEWDTTNRVFLWGALLTDAEHPDGAYVHFTKLDPLDDAEELALGTAFLIWLQARVDHAHAKGQSLAVFHYSHPERTHLVRVLGEDDTAQVLRHFVDLLAVVRAHFIGVAGLSIKQVAPEFGFHWRDEDPGGLQAQAWLEQARQADSTQRASLEERLLQYNEDDVRATKAVREGVRKAQ